ncbi:MAG: RHS repeat domain-containing protein, partial [Candidatus Binatia bacterium]
MHVVQSQRAIKNGIAKLAEPDPDGAGPLGTQTTTFTYKVGTSLLESLTDAAGNVTSYQYDGNGRVTKVISPGGGEETYKPPMTYGLVDVST